MTQVLSFAATLEPDGEGFLVRFPQLPEALTAAESECEALAEAEDCLGEALSARLERGEAIPEQSPVEEGMREIPVPLYLAPKVALSRELKAQAVSIEELARRLDCSADEARNLLHPRSETPPERLQHALAALGLRITVTVDAAA